MKFTVPLFILICFAFLNLDANAQDFKTDIDEFTDEKLLYDEDWKVLYRGPNCNSQEPCLSILQLKPAYIPDSKQEVMMLNFLSVSRDLKYNQSSLALQQFTKDKLYDIEAIINGNNNKTLKMGNYDFERNNDGSAYLESFTVLIDLEKLINMSPENDFKLRINNNVIELEKDDIKYLKSFVSYVLDNR